ncbi:50S ribosomal protein L10, partial [Candidatus Woesearchaeota archaeon]|nr:50S ribosomal protein L10 [Candidatus Woesearchaeota archaeon]
MEKAIHEEGSTMKPVTHIAQWKKDELKDIVQLLQKYNVIGIVDMTNMPSSQLQKMRSVLKKDTLIRMTKARIL